MAAYLVLDLGGTFLKYALMTPEGEILEKGKVPSKADTLDKLLEVFRAAAQPFQGRYDKIAVSMPGRVDTKTGIAHTGGYFTCIQDTPLARLLEEQLGAPVTLANDGKCAAKAELWKGAMAGVENGVVVVLGTGTGGGVILNGQVYMGHTLAAGEFSLMPTDFRLLPQGIAGIMQGNRILWSNFMSASGLIGLYTLQKGGDPYHPQVDGIGFFEAYDAGEPEALAALEEFGKYAAAGIYNIQSVLDVQRFAIGGGISARPQVVDTIRKAVEAQFGAIPFTPFGKPEVVPCAFGNDANLLGALAFCQEQ